VSSAGVSDAGSTTYWAEHAWLPSGLATGVRFEVVAGVFAGVQRRGRPEAGDERLHGVVLPGLANAHSHAFHRMLRGRTHGDGGNCWTWREQMYAVTERLDPDTYFALARAVFTEMVASGYTVVGEFHYLHHGPGGRPYDDPNAMGEALRRAAAEAGIRLTLLDTCYLAGGLTADGHTPLGADQQRFGDGDATRWAAATNTNTTQ
jgi:cytosine/adenosine deaminase-related metal-dependent hydrolase